VEKRIRTAAPGHTPLLGFRGTERGFAPAAPSGDRHDDGPTGTEPFPSSIGREKRGVYPAPGDAVSFTRVLPASTPVNSPSRTAARPLTKTWTMPSES